MNKPPSQHPLREADAEDNRQRPDIHLLVEAVSQACLTMTARDQRISELEDQHRDFEDFAESMKHKLGELLEAHRQADARARMEAERAENAEAEVARLQGRISQLESELEAGAADIRSIYDVIGQSLLLNR